MTRKAPNKIFNFYSITRKIRVWLETQKSAWTGLRRTNGENRVIMKKWNLINKNQYFRHFLMKIWNEEDPYRILFLIAVCPEEPWRINLFEKSSENRDPKKSKKSEIQKLIKIDSKSMSIDQIWIWKYCRIYFQRFYTYFDMIFKGITFNYM